MDSKLTGDVVCTPAEAAEIRVQGEPSFYFTGSDTIRDLGNGKFGEGGRGVDISVQIQIEQAAMVDYNPRTHRGSGEFWEISNTTENGGSSVR